MLSLKEMLAALPDSRMIGDPLRWGAVVPRRVVIDSREVSPGDMFVALRGESRDGHDYINAAVERGAIAVLVERAPDPAPGAAMILVPQALAAIQRLATYCREKHPISVVAVTGSVGKTTTKELIAHVLSQHYHVLKSEGNQNNEIGVPLTLLRLDAAHQRGVLEMAMYAIGEISELCQIAKPRVGVVTNVGPTHLERLGSIEAIARAKAELPESLPRDGLAVLNGDDRRVRAMAEGTQARVVRYGLGPENELRGEDIEVRGLEGIAFRLGRDQNSALVQLPLPGAHNTYAALAAAAVALEDGFTLQEVAEALALATPLRVMPRPGLKGATIIDDTYNASPASNLAALDLLESLSERRIAVLGDMLELGTFEEEGHRQVGRRVAQVAQCLVAVGERGRIIGQEAQATGLAVVYFAANNEEAIAILSSILGRGDVVLVKGSRGMAMEAIVEGIALS